MQHLDVVKSLIWDHFISHFRSSPITSSCVRPGGRRVTEQLLAVTYGCTCLTMWPQTAASGPVSHSATSTSATGRSCPFSSTLPRWPTTPWPCLKSSCLTGCCATGGLSHTLVTHPQGLSRRFSVASNVFPFGHAILTPVAGSSWTWRCGCMRKSEPETIFVTSGTSWASTSWFQLVREIRLGLDEQHCQVLQLRKEVKKLNLFNNDIQTYFIVSAEDFDSGNHMNKREEQHKELLEICTNEQGCHLCHNVWCAMLTWPYHAQVNIQYVIK